MFDIPTWSHPKVAPDRHVQIAKALYSVPGELVGQRLDASTVKLYWRGELIKVHLVVTLGRRHTDPSRSRPNSSRSCAGSSSASSSTRFPNGSLWPGPTGCRTTTSWRCCSPTRSLVATFDSDKLFKRLRGARLDGSYEDEMRKLPRIDLLIIEDLALHRLEATETNDFYELIVERHRNASTVITELIVEGESYRQRQKPRIGKTSPLRLTVPRPPLRPPLRR